MVRNTKRSGSQLPIRPADGVRTRSKYKKQSSSNGSQEPAGATRGPATQTQTQVDHNKDHGKPMTPPITSDMMLPDGKIHMDELNSSPIKKESRNGELQGSGEIQHHNPHTNKTTRNNETNDNDNDNELTSNINSSPLKTKKSVAFSDDIASEAHTSPTKSTKKGSPKKHSTPKKSILKMGVKEENSSNKVNQVTTYNDGNFFPNRSDFWTDGTIVQLPPESPLLERFLHGSVFVLKDREFNKRFEVYASLNHNLKINRPDLLLQILLTQMPPLAHSPPRRINGTNVRPSMSVETNFLSTLSGIIQRDVCKIESIIFSDEEDKENTPTGRKGDPFSIRIISQALKCMSFLMSDGELNNCLPLEDIRWFYMHSSSMIIKPTISKSLTTPYVSIIKECKFGIKKKKMIFNSGSNADIPEHMLSAVLNMKNFPSTSLICEKFIILKNLVQNFPVMMCNNFKHWFEVFLINLCDLNSPLSSKIIGTAIVSLLEISRVYLKNREVKFMVQQCLENKFTSSIRSFASDSKVESPPDMESDALVLDHVQATIHDLISNKSYKSAMDIWVGITILVCDKEKGFEKWSKIDKWINTYRVCLFMNDPSAQIVAISAWKAIVYNLCISDLDNLATPSKSKDVTFNGSSSVKVSERLESKFDLLFSMLYALDLQTLSSEVVDTIDSGILAIFYSLINQKTQKNDEFFKVYWDRIIEPCFQWFYLSDTPLKQIPYLGAKLLIRLMKKNAIVDDKKFNPIRCLSSEPVTINEINSINSKWAYQNYDRVFRLIRLVVSLDSIKVPLKLSLVHSYCNLVRPHIANEVNHSFTTSQIRNNVCVTLKEIFDSNSLLTGDQIFKTFTTTHETFGLESLVMVNEAEEGEFDFLSVITQKIISLPLGNTHVWLSKLFCNVETSKALPLVYSLKKSDISKKLQELVDDKLRNCKINIAADAQLKVAGMLFQDLSEEFTPVVKSVIQDIVLLNEKRFEQAINIIAVQRWSLPIFKYFILLIHDAPHNYMKQMAFNLILLKFEQDYTFVNVIRFLVDSRLDLELFNIRRAMMKKFHTLKGYFEFEFRSILKTYLTSLRTASNFVLLDQFLVTCHEFNFDILVLADGFLEKLPLYKEVSKKEDGSTPAKESQTPTLTEKESQKESSPSPSVVQSLTQKGTTESNLDANSLSDEESDVPDNAFSLETGNDSEINDDSYIETEQSVAREFNSQEDNSFFLFKQDNALRAQKRLLDQDLLKSDTKRFKPNETSIVPSQIEVPATNPDQQLLFEPILSLDTSEVYSNGSQSHQSESKISSLHRVLESIEEQDIKELTSDERQGLETKLLTFMLDIKRIK